MTTSVNQNLIDLTRLRCAAGTDVGMRRDENQDAFAVIKNDAFQAFFVADGMGGVQGGALASRLTKSILEEQLPKVGAAISPQAIIEVVESVNTTVFERGAAEPELVGMGTTLVGLIFSAQGLISVNVGDSRAYRVRDGVIKQLTQDHTVVGELVRSGAISAADAKNHPVSHMLTRSIGPLADVLIECKYELESSLEGDIYVLCSDGLYNFVSDKEILDVVRQNPLDDANQILINLANRRGGSDNITVLVIAVGDSGAKRKHGELSSSAKVRDSENSETSIIPPRVEEPKDLHAERESLKLRKQISPPPQGAIPIWLIVCGAVLFGLVVGDVARRWGALPELTTITSAWKMVTKSLPVVQHETSRTPIVKLEELSRQLELESELRGLVEIEGSSPAEELRLAEALLKRYSTELAEIEAEIDSASRKISLWFGRRKMAEGSAEDIFSHGGAAEQVAVISDGLKRRTSEWMELNYQLRAKQDEFELHPGQDQLRSEISDLKRARQKLHDAVRTEIIQAVDQVLGATYQQLEDLKVRRDNAAVQVSAAKREIEFYKKISKLDLKEREELRHEMQLELDRIKGANSRDREGRAQ